MDEKSYNFGDLFPVLLAFIVAPALFVHGIIWAGWGLFDGQWETVQNGLIETLIMAGVMVFGCPPVIIDDAQIKFPRLLRRSLVATGMAISLSGLAWLFWRLSIPGLDDPLGIARKYKEFAYVALVLTIVSCALASVAAVFVARHQRRPGDVSRSGSKRPLSDLSRRMPTRSTKQALPSRQPWHYWMAIFIGVVDLAASIYQISQL